MNTFSEIGRDIFERIPASKIPYWGSLLLAVLKQLLLVEPKEISDLRELINSNEWHNAHNQFLKVRDLSLRHSGKQKELYFRLAENISKLTYNQSRAKGHFDSDAGYSIYQFAFKLAQVSNSKEMADRVQGILNLFEPKRHASNYFAIYTLSAFEVLVAKLISSNEGEFAQLRNELPRDCAIEEVKLVNPKSIMHIDKGVWPDGSFEFQYDIEYKEQKIGYYALIWDIELELIDEICNII